MPKLFPISIEVEEEAVGRVLRVLNATEGIAKLHLRLDKEVKPEVSQQEGGVVQTTPSPPALRDGRTKYRGGPPSGNPCFKAIAEVLLKTPAHYKILAAAIQRAGFMGTGIHGFLFRMSKLKLVQRTSPGSYRITEKGIRTFGKKDTAPMLERQKMNRNALSSFYRAINNYSGFRLTVLTALNKEGDMRSADMKQRVVDAGFSEKNLSTTGIKLRNEGLITVDEDGWYHLTDKGKQVMDNRPSLENDLDHNQEGIDANG